MRVTKLYFEVDSEVISDLRYHMDLYFSEKGLDFMIENQPTVISKPIPICVYKENKDIMYVDTKFYHSVKEIKEFYDKNSKYLKIVNEKGNEVSRYDFIEILKNTVPEKERFCFNEILAPAQFINDGEGNSFLDSRMSMTDVELFYSALAMKLKIDSDKQSSEKLENLKREMEAIL